jgi:maltoporin
MLVAVVLCSMITVLHAEEQLSTDGIEPEKVMGEDMNMNTETQVGYGFEYHAYLRSGVLEGIEGGKGVPFQAPNAPAKYRLGNEAETYGELGLQKNFNVGEDGVQVIVPILLAYKTYEDNQWSAETDEFTMREVYGEFSGLDFDPDAKIWAGNRFYDRKDIHINDFYWLDTSGYGGGIRNYNLYDTGLTLDVAYLRGAPEQDIDLEGIGQISKQTIDMRLKNIDIGMGNLEVVFLGSFVKGGTYDTTLTNGDEKETTTTVVDSEYGFSACLIHNYNYSDSSFNTFALQYGNGVGKDFSSSLWAVDDVVDSSTWRFRCLDFGVYQPNDKFAMMYSLISDTFDSGADEDSFVYWYSVGARPTYYFDKNWSLALEAGYDYTIGEGQGEDGSDLRGSVTKITFCPQVALDSTFFSRPVLRAFVTYAFWSDDFENIVGGEANANETAGLNFGVQVEAWF